MVRTGRSRNGVGYGPDTWVTDQTGDMGDSSAEEWVTKGLAAVGLRA